MHPKPTSGISLLPGWEQLPAFWGQPVCKDLFCWQSVVLFHSEWLPIILTGFIKSIKSACGGRWNSAGVAPGAASPLLGNLCAQEAEAALFQLVTKAWPPWLVCLMDALQLRGQQGLRKEFSALQPLQRAQARVVCRAARTGFRHIWVSTVADGVSWRQEDVAASLSLTKATEGVLGGVSSCPATHPRASGEPAATCTALGCWPPTLGSFWGCQRAQSPCAQMQIKTWGGWQRFMC